MSGIENDCTVECFDDCCRFGGFHSHHTRPGSLFAFCSAVLGEIQHSHAHSHFSKHIHFHDQTDGSSIAPWVLFIVLVFGPCEPLIAILMYPAAHESVFALVVVTVVFGVVTIGTMLAAVILARAGVNFLPLAAVHRFTHVIAGATISLCGLAIVFLGL